jgi:hypothetical protein
MTTIQLYRKHKAGEISREKFLYEVRRDNNLPFITNLTSYDDAVKILKNKGIVTEVDTKEAKADEAVKAETKAKAPSTKKPESLSIDVANPYEYRHGLQYELEQGDDYSDEALEKAKTTVLKNLAKDANFYSTLLNQKQSHYEFKAPETDAPGMQAKADGYLKKELKKDEKANVKDSLSKSEAAKGKPKGVKEMPDKGVEGKEKTIKEGLEEAKKSKYITVDEEGDYQLNSKAIEAYLKSAIDPEEIENVDIFMNDDEGYGESSMYFFDNYTDEFWKYDDPTTTPDKEIEDWAKQELSYWLFSSPDEFPSKGMSEDIESDPVNGDSSAEGQFNDLMSRYDWYYEMSDDPRKYDTGTALDQKLKSLAQTIGTDRAVELFNLKAPSDRKVTSTFFMEGKDKLSKIKEALKKALRKEGETEDENAKKSAVQTEKAKLIALNKQKSELQADTTKPKDVKNAEIKGIDLKMRAANDSLTKINSGKIDVV